MGSNIQKETGQPAMKITDLIMIVRNEQAIIDRDLAGLYGVETKALNQAVKRNMERFPKRFMFQLTGNEKEKLVTNCDRFENLKHSTTFTVQPFNRSHDRFLCIDHTVYHIGASLKDLGKKWFAFSKMNIPANVLLQQI
jgi:hypothetical protein